MKKMTNYFNLIGSALVKKFSSGINKLISRELSELIALATIKTIILLLVVTSILFYNVLLDEKIKPFSICLKKECIKYFSDQFSVIISLYPIVGTLYGATLTIVGFVVAYRQFSLSKESAKFTNHLANISHFNTTVRNLLQKKSILSIDDLDINILYSLVFPNSHQGHFDKQDLYLSKIFAFGRCLMERNNDKKIKKASYTLSKSEFIDHKKNVRRHCNYFGIQIGDLNEGEFYDAENEVTWFLDQVTTIFTLERRKSYHLTQIDRFYAK
jgi:hypothetical protein